MTGAPSGDTGTAPHEGDGRQSRAPQYRQILRSRRPSAVFAQPAPSGEGLSDVASPDPAQDLA